MPMCKVGFLKSFTGNNNNKKELQVCAGEGSVSVLRSVSFIFFDDGSIC